MISIIHQEKINEAQFFLEGRTLKILFTEDLGTFYVLTVPKGVRFKKLKLFVKFISLLMK
jgi:hypothetical protein